ncbi:MAG: M28 family peptidase [Bacillati bacterium ANGP1]|uniref:M28 family peptidase n=1 Tax=Candidatus Segetimicrobium genomatis TaxID=2569760 RepID=A0A537L5H0_9BACT|nr:MAG: M28 family peptidase [Terrabacteria group bacterium ANGP1]
MSWTATWKDPHEQAVTAAVTLDAPWALVERFDTLVRDSGGKAERRGIEYIIKQLAKWGVPHTLHEPELLISVPRRARLEVLAPEPKALTAKTPSMSLSMDGHWQRGPLAYVPTGQAGAITAIFERAEISADVEGRVVLTEGYPSPGKVAALQERGARAAIFISPGERIHEGICTTIWGSPDLDSIGRKPKIPVLAVNKSEGRWLRDLAQSGAVKVRYSTKLDEGWRPIPVLVAEIRGTVEPEKFVLLHGHIDSWHQGIGDNATGDATLLETARVLWQHRQHLRRSVRIAWWSGHSHGRYAGSTWFADAFAMDIDENCVLHINCDSPGCRWATVFEDVFWMSEAEGIARAVIRDVTGQDSSGGRPLRAGDKSFSNIGVSTFYMLSSTMPKDMVKEKNYYPTGGCGGNIAWHTEDDTLEIADRDHLLRDIKVYAAAVLRAANSPIYPLDFAAVAAEFEQTLRRYQEAAGSQFDLGEAVEDARALGQDAARFYDRIAGLASASVDDPRVKRANEVQRRLARILVPINYTRAGRFRHDPAVDVPPLPDLEPAARLASLEPGSEAHRVTVIHLTRGRNRVRSGLRAARQVLAEAGA